MSAQGRRIRPAWAEPALAVAAFAALCAIVLSVAPQSAEPDDGAYRASIVAMTEGHFLRCRPHGRTLARKLGDNPAAPPNQWVELADGRYISEKDPGYPFLAAPSRRSGLSAAAPLFYGALACLGLFIGARRWLGVLGGLSAVGLYCSSGATLAFAWRDTCRRSPMRRWSRPGPAACSGRCSQPKQVRADAPGPVSRDSWRSSSRPSSATPTS